MAINELITSPFSQHLDNIFVAFVPMVNTLWKLFSQQLTVLFQFEDKT